MHARTSTLHVVKAHTHWLGRWEESLAKPKVSRQTKIACFVTRLLTERSMYALNTLIEQSKFMKRKFVSFKQYTASIIMQCYILHMLAGQ